MVLLMSVNPGFGGQKYIPYTTQKIRDLKKMMEEKHCQADIEVDGGVSLNNVQEVPYHTPEGYNPEQITASPDLMPHLPVRHDL